MSDISNHAPNVEQFLAAGKKSGEARKQRPSFFMSDKDKWELAKYLIENKMVALDKDGKFIKYRMFVKDIVEEVNTLEVLGKDRPIKGDHQLRSCMEFYQNMNEFLGNPIRVPVQETVQDDMLKAELAKVMTERDKLHMRVEHLEQLYAKAILRLEDSAKFMTMAFKNEYNDFATPKSVKLR